MENLVGANGLGTFAAMLPSSFLAASPVAKFVMILLAFASIWSWVLIGEGLFTLSRLKRALKLEFAGKPAPLIEPVIAAGRTACEISIAQESSGELRHRLVEAMNRRAQDLLTQAEGGLPNLAVIASVAPFIGLFGTVYGIMTSFAGIAEALAATAWGLAASIAYNRLGAALARSGLKLAHLIEERAVEIVAGRKPRSLREVA